MKRRLFNLLTLASIAPLLVFAAAWVRSLHGRVHTLSVVTPIPHMTASCGGGGVSLWYIRAAYGRWGLSAESGEFGFPLHRYTSHGVLGRVGVQLIHAPYRVTRDGPTRVVRCSILSMPCWLPLSLFSLLPAASCAFALRQRFAFSRARAAGLCAQCGYDVRATPDRCPECGEPARTGSV